MEDNRNKRSQTGAVLRKFYRDVQQNRILSEAKQKQFVGRKVSRVERRTSAIRKARIKRVLRGY